ncbi:SdpI family protein [Herbiconiux moechotypicola]|uniref:SdpI family protein n=1 Tax=Herbiconiux moechotypicola TaxID=637393 RepID=A0ABN3DI05_9MICO|nr:SdpI family protein [Herbiconiux moechotypicola]MCS5729678.1 SdpI family protein [Herbiconiux moechotypicola]
MAIVPVLGWVFTGLLAVLVVACVTAARGIVPVNSLFGVRTAAVMRSPAAWRAGHAVGILPSAVAFVLALGFSLVGLAVSAVSVGAIVVFAGGVLWVIVASGRAASRV